MTSIFNLIQCRILFVVPILISRTFCSNEFHISNRGNIMTLLWNEVAAIQSRPLTIISQLRDILQNVDVSCSTDLAWYCAAMQDAKIPSVTENFNLWITSRQLFHSTHDLCLIGITRWDALPIFWLQEIVTHIAGTDTYTYTFSSTYIIRLRLYPLGACK